MKQLLVRWGIACSVVVAMTGCGGGGSGSGNVQPPSSAAVNSAIATASALAANDTATNYAAPFTVVQAAGVPVVTVNSPPKVNFAVFSDGAVKTDLKITDVSFAIAKLVPGANGEPDQWVNYIHRTRAAATASTTGVYTDAVKATLTSPKFASTIQAYTDPKQTDAALLAAQLVYNPDGYYTYTFTTDIKDETKTVGQDGKPVKYEPNLTHRVAIQLSYTNAAGETIKVNPYFDFTIDANGKSVPVTDPTKTRKMTDVASCNGCHQKLAMHGGGRVDTQFCVMCHNPGTTDANSGNVLNLATMVHKIHAGKLLKSKLAVGGENYTVRSADFSEVGFPQDLRNCTVCHSGANPKTPQGDNWKTKPSKEACLTCHASAAGSTWEPLHKVVAGMRYGSTAQATALTNADCADCHKVGATISSERVHFNQVEVNAAKYKMNIENVAFNDTADHKARSVTVKYFLSDPTNGNAAYNLVTSECTGTAPAIACADTTKFGNLRFYLAFQNMVGQPDGTTEFSAYNNGGSGANAFAYKGSNDGSNHYTVSISVPDDSAIAVVKGTARVVSIGQIVEHKLSATASTDPRPEVVPTVLVNTVVQHAYKELALTGALLPRRAIVSSEKCNVCHGALGATSGSNTLANAFHSGARNTVEACVTCHDANRMSSTVMTNGMALNESYQFKRMIHGIHGNSKRTYPFTQGNPVQGVFSKAGTLQADGIFLADYKIRNFTPTVVAAGTTVSAGSTFETIADLINAAAKTAGYTGLPQSIENYAAEVAYPDATLNCNACHVNNSYKTDKSPLGSVVFKGAGVTDPNKWLVISPKAATCTSCHDGNTASGQPVIDHVTLFGGASFGVKTQADAALPRESCDDCHASGGVKSVDTVHGQK